MVGLSPRSPSGALVAERVVDCWDEVAALLAARGHEAGQYHALSPDPWKALWNEDRTGAALFLEERYCVFQWRSPVTAPGDELEMLARLRRYAKQRHKTLIGVLVNEAYCRAGVELGMTPIWLGSETFHDLGTWSIEGGRRQKLRWARNHARKLGYEWREVFPLENAADRRAIEQTELHWKDARKQRKTDSFNRTSFAELTEIRRYFACEEPITDVAEGTARRIVAYVGCTPVNSTGWYLQDPVRMDDAPRGALEGCFVAALDAMRDDGYAFASNGPLPFWRPEGSPDDAYRLGTFGSRVVNFFDRQYRFRGINQFRSKLDPDRVEPLYILLTRRFVTPTAARSVVKVLTKRISS
jgi:lysylphosphatidylglycerol synthetase-like protein (DUF2156 family)